jgi:hypothetical protein
MPACLPTLHHDDAGWNTSTSTRQIFLESSRIVYSSIRIVDDGKETPAIAALLVFFYIYYQFLADFTLLQRWSHHFRLHHESDVFYKEVDSRSTAGMLMNRNLQEEGAKQIVTLAQTVVAAVAVAVLAILLGLKV